MGKTVTTLSAIADTVYLFETHKVLIVAPKRVALSSWHNELENWDHLSHLTYSIAAGKPPAQREKAVSTNADITIINRENIPWLVEYFKEKWPYTWLVIDEASSFKNHAAKRFKSLKKVRHLMKNVTLLSGTPSPQGVQDLWAQIYLLDQGERLGRNITAFRNRWFKQDYMGYSYEPLPHANDEIKEKVSDLMVSMKAEDYLELPKLNIVDIPVILDAKIKKQYDQFAEEMVLDEFVVTEAAALAQKLCQMANGAFYHDDDVIHMHDSKIEALKEIFEDNPNEQFLIAYSFKHDLTRIKEAFPKAETIKDDSTIERWNKGEIDILLAHPASCGHGLNLQKNKRGNTAIWFGQTWSLELRQQFDARLMRQGKDRSVTIINLIAKDTIDERIQQAIKDKCGAQAALMRAIKFNEKAR